MEMFYILIDCGNGCINTFVKIHRIVLWSVYISLYVY
jgi:hypothetical protein